ncbi:MAG TPA: MFS transporter [Anaerolineaceae bacterium]
METKQSNGGMRAFLIIWIGQLVSLVGSQLTGFALSVFVYDQTKSVFLLALTQIAQQAPYILLSPLAGVLSDRWNRRTAMVISDLGSGLAVLAVAILYFSGVLAPWMVIPINLWMSSFNTLMWPAYTSAVTLLVPKAQYGRANGFMQLGEALPQVAGPALAGVLYVTIRTGSMALIDFFSYLFAVTLMLLFVRIPNPPHTLDGQQAKGSIWKEMAFGWNYITARKPLLALLLFFMASNFISGIMSPLIVPLILDTWGATTLGYLSTIMGVGMLVGTLVMSAWGGGKRKVYTLLGAGIASGLFLMFATVRPSVTLLGICGFMLMFLSPFMNASSQAIWQAKVAPDVQGRVFAVRRGIAWSTQIIAPLLSAPLADHIFKPGMTAGGALVGVFGPLFGTGASRGVALLISLTGVLSMTNALIALANRTTRRVELDLPDHDQSTPAAAQSD